VMELSGSVNSIASSTESGERDQFLLRRLEVFGSSHR